MGTEQEFFSELKEWSIRKLKIVSKYLDGFARILGNSNGPIYYIDGFAGKGFYDGGEKGSPVLAAEIAQSPKSLGKLNCIFIEKNEENYKDLVKHTNEFSNSARCLNSSFSEKVDEVLKITKDTACLFFLDDFGVKGTDWLSVEKILSREEITDIWIRFDHSTIMRLDGFLQEQSSTHSGKANTLVQYFGITDLSFLHNMLNGNNPEEKRKKAVNLYKMRLKETLGESGFVGAYPIKSLDNLNKYHLLFVCKHEKAAVLASDIVNSVEENLPIDQVKYRAQKELNKSGQMSLFNFEPTPEELYSRCVEKIKGKILNEISQSDLSVWEIRCRLIYNNDDFFGCFRQKHVTDALKQLKAESIIEIEGAPSKDDTNVKMIRY